MKLFVQLGFLKNISMLEYAVCSFSAIFSFTTTLLQKAMHEVQIFRIGIND